MLSLVSRLRLRCSLVPLFLFDWLSLMLFTCSSPPLLQNVTTYCPALMVAKPSPCAFHNHLTTFSPLHISEPKFAPLGDTIVNIDDSRWYSQFCRFVRGWEHHRLVLNWLPRRAQEPMQEDVRQNSALLYHPLHHHAHRRFRRGTGPSERLSGPLPPDHPGIGGSVVYLVLRAFRAPGSCRLYAKHPLQALSRSHRGNGVNWVVKREKI